MDNSMRSIFSKYVMIKLLASFSSLHQV